MKVSLVDREKMLRGEIVRACQLLYARGLIAATDGNISARLDDAHLVTTPTGLAKGLLREADLVVTDMEGQVVEGGAFPLNGYRPSAELRLHLEVYHQRADVNAVVHSHAPMATALSVAGISLAPCVMPETLVTLGTIVTTRYATPTSAQGPEVIRELIGDHDALLLDRHGPVTVGRTVMEAYAHTEKVENTAVVLAEAHKLGRVQILPLDEIRRLSAMRDGLLGSERHFAGPDCKHCRACPGLPEML